MRDTRRYEEWYDDAAAEGRNEYGRSARGPTPGKRTVVPQIWSAVQADGGIARSADDVRWAAAAGVGGAGGTLPHLATIQRAFGHHDVTGIRAHVGGAAAEAAEAIGARAYATGDDVAFAREPEVRQAAHEAAHVVQQRGGVRLDGGVGRAGDPYERHADAVADRVVRGESAEALLDGMAHRGAAGGPAVQREDRDGDGIDDDAPAALPASLRTTVERVTDFAVLQETTNALASLLATATPTVSYGVPIGGAEYPVQGRHLRALLACVEARASALDALSRGLAGRTGGGTGPEHARGEGTAHGAGGGAVGADADGGLDIIDTELPIGPLGTLHFKITMDRSISSFAPPATTPASGGGASFGGGVHAGPEGIAAEVEATGALRELFLPDCHAIADHFELGRDHDGVQASAGVEFPPFNIGTAQLQFSLDLFEIEAGRHGLRVTGPTLTVEIEARLGDIWGNLPADFRSRFSGTIDLSRVMVHFEIKWEPPWREIARQLGVELAEGAAEAGVAATAAGGAGAAATDALAADAVIVAEGAEIGAGAFEAAELALLVVAAPEVLIVGALVGVAIIAYAVASSGSDSERSEADPPMSTDTLHDQDAPLTHLGRTFGRAIEEFCAAYAAALRGEPASGAGDAATNGHTAGAQRSAELIAGGHPAADVTAMARATGNLEQQVRRANVDGFVSQAGQLAERHAAARAAELHRSHTEVLGWAREYLESVARSGWGGRLAPAITRRRHAF